MKSVKLPAAAFAIAYALLGLAFTPLFGIQNDEAIFASQLYSPVTGRYHVGPVPFMVMDYAGCLKTWIYAAVFGLFPPSAWSLRVPVILIGAATLFLFTVLLNRAGELRAAWIGAALLAFDPVFALTNNFDWGPVALQHFLLMAGLLAATEFHRTKNWRFLALTWFSFGLGLWDKALFIWLLVPVWGAALFLWPWAVRDRFTRRNLYFAVCSFALGASPLLWFNVTHGWITFRSHTVFSTADLAQKIRVLRATADGSALFGFMVRGHSKSDVTVYGFLLALLALPFLWRTGARKPALFALLVMLGAWLQMTFNQGTGGAAHHTVLLWPLPQFFIALALARFRRVGMATALVLIVSSSLVYLQYWRNVREQGPALVWSDAMWSVSEDPLFSQANPICLLDWGLADPLTVMHRGRLPLRNCGPELLPVPRALWITHPERQELFVGATSRLMEKAEAEGLRKVPVKTYFDRHGNAIFEAFRFTSRSRPPAHPLTSAAPRR